MDPRGATSPLATDSQRDGHWEQAGSLGALQEELQPALSPGSLPGYGNSGRGGGGNNYSGGASYNTGSHGGYGGGSGGGGSSYQGKQGQYKTLPQGSFPFGAFFFRGFFPFGARGQVPKSHPHSTGGAPALRPDPQQPPFSLPSLHRWIFLAVQLQLPGLRPKLQRPPQFLPGVPRRLRQKRSQHELPVQIKQPLPPRARGFLTSCTRSL